MNDGPTLTEYSADAPLALFTEFSPSLEGGGCMNIKSLLTPRERARIVWITTAAANDKAGADGPVVHLQSAAQGPMALLRNCTVRAGAIARELAEVLRARRARGLWLIAHGIAVPVGSLLSRQSPVKMHVTVNDDPVFATAILSRQLLPIIPYLDRSFAHLLRGAASVEVMNHNMRRRYHERYRVASLISNRGVSRVTKSIVPYDKKRGLRVGLLGNTYTYGVLRTIALAVAAAGRELGVEATLVIVGGGRFGGRLVADGVRGLQIVAAGHVEEARAIALLQDTFIQYLGYPFGRRGAVLRQTSFPIKLVTYLQTGRPILVHAAPDASTHELGDFAPFVLRWTDDDVAAGGRALAAFFRSWSDEVGADAAEAIRRRHFDLDAHRETTFGALNRLVNARAVVRSEASAAPTIASQPAE